MEIKPEMLGKIVDDSHYNFHVTAKSKVINAYHKMKSGKDFFLALTKLDFKTDPRWLRNSCNDPSVKALLYILEEYKTAEHRPARAKILVTLFEYAIGLYASDLFFRERGAWLISQIIKRQGQFGVCKIPMFQPENWYPMGRNNTGRGESGDLYQWENKPDAPSIEEEYALWYGVDVTGETINIDQSNKERIIKGQREWMEANGLAEICRQKVEE